MKNRKKLIAVLSLLALMSLQGFASQDNNRQKVWYKQPAKVWMESSPLGNGRIGAMVYGGIETETVALNEITMWSGEPDKFQERLCGKDMLNEIRQIFFAGDYSRGNKIASGYLAGTPHSFGTHVPLGDLKMDFKYPQGNVSDYKRELNLENAINTVTFNVGSVKYTREYFCSNPDEALIIKLSVSKTKALNLALSFDLLRESDVRTTSNGIEFSGKVSFPKQGPGGVNFSGKVGVTIKDGKIVTKDGKVEITDASSIVIAFDVRTDYSNKTYKEDCVKTVNNVLAQNYDKVRQKHITDYSNLYKRVDLFLGNSKTDNLPTDVRWKKVKDGANDIGLDALFFNYARYLLIAASRENSPLPTNLQGIWNDNLACNTGWTNDYHLDINTEQNYWLSNIGNLAECNKPLFDYIKYLSVEGQKTAKNVYGARGWTAHTVANVWGYTASGESTNWGLFPTASSWMASHLWTQYNYTLDKQFLKDKAYPILKSNAEFLLDYMVVNPNNGYLMTGPSTSPENAFMYKGEELSLSMMPTVDRVLVFETLNSCIEISEILGVDKNFRDSLKTTIAKLPPFKIGKNGGVQEWFEDFDEAQPNHRHTSHLLSLYPFSQISPVKTPALAEAARKTMELRLAAKGWEDVEWSRANLICNYARLFDAEKAYESVVLLERNFSRENLLTISPEGIAGAPYDIFIFDGNEAGGAGIAEMLLQSHEGYIQFLPALPKEWNNGYFNGLCVLGGGIIDLKWTNGEVTEAKLKATTDNTFRLKVPQKSKKVQFSKNGKPFNLAPDADGFVEFKLNANDFLELK